MRRQRNKAGGSATALAAAVLAATMTAQQPSGGTPPPTEPPVVQEPQPAPPPAPPPQPQPAPPAPPAVIDPTRAAADLLRRRLGLQSGPQGQPPSGPPAVPPPAPAPAQPVDPAVDPAVAPAELQPQEPQPSPPPNAPPVQDPTRAAAEALRRLLPNAKPPAVAPIPNASGTPEPVLPGTDPVAETAASASAKLPPATTPVRGTFSTRYRARHGGGATDQDVVSRLEVDVGDRERDAVTAHLRVRSFWNADGTRRDDPFPGLDHSFGDSWNTRLYAGHLDVHRQGELQLARLGRQDLDETPTTLQFDGLRLDSRSWAGPTRLWFSAYAGVPVHQFEQTRHGDLVAGVATGFVPWQGGRVRLDGMRIEDEFLALDRQDDLLGARWWQQLAGVTLNGLHTWRDGKPRDLVLGGRGELPLAVQCDISWRELLTTQRQQVTELDPFWLIGFDYAPYRQLGATLRRDLSTQWSIGVGADLRRLRDGSDERGFNREFERWFADLACNDLFVRGLSLSIAASLWNSTGEDFRTLTGELVYRPDRDLRLSLGSGYDLFRYDVFDARERLHVRSWFVRAERRLDASLRVDGGYELQRDDFDEFHVFRLGVTWTF